MANSCVYASNFLFKNYVLVSTNTHRLHIKWYRKVYYKEQVGSVSASSYCPLPRENPIVVALKAQDRCYLVH